MGIRDLIRDHRDREAQTPEGQAKVAKAAKAKGIVWKTIVFSAVAFVLALAVNMLNNQFHWWEPRPW